MSVIFLALMATAFTPQSSKDFLSKDPRLAGAKIVYCEAKQVSSCKTINRSREANDNPNVSADIGKFNLLLIEVVKPLESLSVDFEKSDINPKILEFKFKAGRDQESNSKK